MSFPLKWTILHIISWVFVHFVVPLGIFPIGNLGRFPQGKPDATVALPNLHELPAVYIKYFCVTTPLAVRPTLLRQMDTGSSTCAQIWVHAVHTKDGQAQSRESTRRHTKTVPHPAPPGDWTQGLQIPTHWATSPVCFRQLIQNTANLGRCGSRRPSFSTDW